LKTECFGARFRQPKPQPNSWFSTTSKPSITAIADTAPWVIARLRSSKSTGSAPSAEGCSGGGSKGSETYLIEQVGSSRFCCEQLREFFKSPETTRSNHPRAFNPQAKPLTSTNK
jgi:hypothetical protein